MFKNKLNRNFTHGEIQGIWIRYLNILINLKAAYIPVGSRLVKSKKWVA